MRKSNKNKRNSIKLVCIRWLTYIHFFLLELIQNYVPFWYQIHQKSRNRNLLLLWPISEILFSFCFVHSKCDGAEFTAKIPLKVYIHATKLSISRIGRSHLPYVRTCHHTQTQGRLNTLSALWFLRANNIWSVLAIHLSYVLNSTKLPNYRRENDGALNILFVLFCSINILYTYFRCAPQITIYSHFAFMFIYQCHNADETMFQSLSDKNQCVLSNRTDCLLSFFVIILFHSLAF